MVSQTASHRAQQPESSSTGCTPTADNVTDLRRTSPDRASEPLLQTSELRSNAVPVRHADGLSYEQFVAAYMAPNLPVMIQVSTSLSFALV